MIISNFILSFNKPIFLRKTILLIVLLLLLSGHNLLAATPNRALIVFEGKDTETNPAKGDGLQLYELLGHFDLQKKIVAADDYQAGECSKFDFVFFVGFSNDCQPPTLFLDDAYHYKGVLTWLNTGLVAFNARHNLKEKYGFVPVRFDSLLGFNSVVALDKNERFTKGDGNLTLLEIFDHHKVNVLAEAFAPKHLVMPYAIHSRNLYYFADMPFAYMSSTDRYLFFAEKLHDILGQEHQEYHPALIRIEDVDPTEDPDKIRKIADLLYSEHVPFLVAVVPFYVDPENNERISMSDRPDMVDALRYAETHGGTIVMHGVTHQYHGVTTNDFEFWDGTNNRPIANDNANFVEQRIETGVEELMRNGIYPIAWETPHYGASAVDYGEIGKIFSTAVEQRLVMNNLDYSQFFPYEIYHDMYGERIIPENLGYVPLGTDQEEEKAVQDILEGARKNLYVRDGYATAFFHPFMPIGLLKQIIDGIRDLGYTYIDLKDSQNFVELHDRSIVTGKASLAIYLEDQYLKETYINQLGDRVKRVISDHRLSGRVDRNISLPQGWIYAAEPVEYREKELTFFDKLVISIKSYLRKLFSEKKRIVPAVAAVIWDSTAQGGAKLDQNSFVTALRSVGIPTDILSPTDSHVLWKYNLIVVPYSAADILPDSMYDAIEEFISNGGNLVTDSKNPLAQDLGVKFGTTVMRLEKVRDKLFPEDVLSWGTFESVYRINVEENDEILCTNDLNDAPVVILRNYGKGKIIEISARFDPISGAGYARFPYLIEWLKYYAHLYPVLRRDFVEMYFDPGLHRNISIETLAKLWAERGIRIIHVAGWHEYPKFTYDYDRLIRVCHAYGIIVYVWIEPPQVSKKFYDDHPEWHEKNYKGEDVRPDWRYPVALTDSNCLRAASEWTKNLLSNHDWDGVNIAELYFGGEGAPADPQLMTPFNQSARDLFKKKYGFDPVQLFQSNSSHYYKSSPQDWQSFLNFRAALVTKLTAHYLQLARDAFENKPGTQIVLTVLDEKDFPELRNTIGVDIDQLIKLRSQYNFALQVEDPESNWNSDPRRYLEIGSRYKNLLGADSLDLMIDLNILSFRKSNYNGMFPTLTPTGIESYLLVRSAAEAAPRMTIYSEATAYPQDISEFPYAIAAGATLRIDNGAFEVSSPFSTAMKLSDDVSQISIDGRSSYPVHKGYFLIPAGTHIVKIVNTNVNPFESELIQSHISASSCNLLDLKTFQRGVQFVYDSPVRCAVSFNKIPFAVFIDDHEIPFVVNKEEQNYGIILPAGRHRALVVLESTVSYGIDITSLWSSALIVVFGVLAGSILIVLYIILKIRRRKLIGV